MPVIDSTDMYGKPVKRYGWPAHGLTPRERDHDNLRQWRKEAIKDRDFFLEAQKSCGKEDREYAKFFKEAANRNLRLQRACTLMLPWFGEGDNGQIHVEPSLWPIELADELDEIARRIFCDV